MIGRIISFKDDYFFAFIPPESDLFAMDEPIVEEQYNFYKKHSIPIYKLGLIKENVKENWRKLNGQKVTGNIIRENFQSYLQLEPSFYNQEELEKEAQLNKEEQQRKLDETKTMISIKAILGNFKKSALTVAQYEYLQQIAKEEGLISSFFSNGFAINYQYICYGKLTKDKKISFPQLKIKEPKKSK